MMYLNPERKPVSPPSSESAVMTALALDVRAMPLFHARVKRDEVETIIDETATAHAVTDFAFNLLGFVPIPGMGFAGAAASIVAQAPLFYQPMVTKIAAAYMHPVDQPMRELINETTWLGAEFDIASAFGVEFLTDLAGEIVTEAGLGWIASKFVPIFGPMLSGGMDAVIASTLTWRVGVAAAIYYENGLSWIADDQKATYTRAKAIVGGFDIKTGKRVDLELLRKRVPEIKSSSVRTTMELARMLRKNSIPIATIQRTLRDELGIDADIVDAAIRDLR